jgi:formylglycine-generating enzyme required for sulfatase activity
VKVSFSNLWIPANIVMLHRRLTAPFYLVEYKAMKKKSPVPPRFCVLFLLMIWLASSAHANNVQVVSHGITDADNINQNATISFDLSWDNSWRDSINHDAVWVFVKYRTSLSTEWHHATMNYVDGTADGHTAPPGAVIRTPSDRKGVYIHRAAFGSGTVNFLSCGLLWDYSADGLTSDSIVDLRIFAVEMVFVPQGAFYVGDGATTELYGNFEDGVSGNPLLITSENDLILGGGTPGSLGNNNRANTYTHPACTDGCLPGSGDDFDDVTFTDLVDAFPKGYNAFYCMKYEVTQQQWVDMLNCVTPAQQPLLADTSHFYSWTGPYITRRWGITFSGGVFSTSEPYLPLIYCDWVRAAAYADWACMRPMTELEFEKAARGPATPTPGEYPWGNPAIALASDITVSGMSTANEEVLSGYDGGGTNGNCWILGGAHNMNTLGRVGIFASNAANTGRVTSGGSYWGIMDLGGNAWERAVSVGHSEGRKFTGAHGDGILHPAGYANIATWPGSFSNWYVDTNVGMGYRGGGMAYPGPNIEHNARISSRVVGSAYYNTVIHDDGFRLVRSDN